MNKMICKNCTKWHKVGQGTVKDKTEQGYCDFMNSRIHTIWENDEPVRDKNNRALVINTSSEIFGKIGDLEISSTSKNLISRHAWVWTDANFWCIKFELKQLNKQQ